MKNKKIYKPEIFDLSKKTSRVLFEKFRRNKKDTMYIDTLGEQKHELSLIRKPSLITHKSLDPNQTK